MIALVDLANLMFQARDLNRRTDLPALSRYLADPEEGRRLVDMYVYATLPPDNGERTHRFHDFLRHSGLMVVQKRAKRLPDGQVKANVDSLLILDAMELAQVVRPDVIVIVAGDGDYAPLALRLRRYGISVEVASTRSALAGELQASANGVIFLEDFLQGCEPLNGQESGTVVGTESILGNL